MGNKDLFQKVKELALPIGRYVLFGSAPLGIRNLRECADIDIVVTQDIWDKYKARPDWQLDKTRHGNSYLRNGSLELLKDWKPGIWDIEKLIKEAEIIDGLPFVRLEYVVEWKRLNAREKDLKDIEIIENFLRQQR